MGAAPRTVPVERPFSLPPGPADRPLVQLAAVTLRPLTYLTRCRERHGDLFTLRVPALRIRRPRRR